jgi:hypothetical protein
MAAAGLTPFVPILIPVSFYDWFLLHHRVFLAEIVSSLFYASGGGGGSRSHQGEKRRHWRVPWQILLWAIAFPHIQNQIGK